MTGPRRSGRLNEAHAVAEPHPVAALAEPRVRPVRRDDVILQALLRRQRRRDARAYAVAWRDANESYAPQDVNAS